MKTSQHHHRPTSTPAVPLGNTLSEGVRRVSAVVLPILSQSQPRNGLLECRHVRRSDMIAGSFQGAFSIGNQGSRPVRCVANPTQAINGVENDE